MTNHVHLLVTPSEPGACSALMKRLAQSHAQYCNRTWKRTGPLWEGRFKDSLVDSAGYGLACQRYIELNPVRAGMVRHPGAYPWSSYRSNAMGEPQPMLSLLPAFRALAEDDDSRRRLYRQMFDEPESADLLDEIRAALRKETPLGTESFLDEMEAVSGRRFRRRAGMRGRQGLSPKGL